MRRLTTQVCLDPSDFIAPLFITEGEQVKSPIRSMPGQFQWSIDLVKGKAKQLHELGIPAILLFGVPETKDSEGSGAYAEAGLIQRALREIKEFVPDLLLICDLCLCEYTDHGHCGIINAPGSPQFDAKFPHGYLLNDATLERLERIAVSQAMAGADIVAPSGMIDGMVGAIRGALDRADYSQVGVLSYAVKYASAFYGPFREAAAGAPQFGDRHSHQMDPANVSQIFVESQLDIDEGADFIMIKPALAYLDVIHRLSARHPEIPIVAYNVSGEYAMIKAAAKAGWLDERQAILECLLGIKRAGADILVSYHAEEVCQWL